MRSGFDLRKSIQELESHDWGEATYGSYLVTTCHRLRRKPLIEFTLEDLRLMIGQEISLPILIPIALERLEEEPLAKGDFYPGDLLAAVLRIDDLFWSRHPEPSLRISQIVRRAKEFVLSLEEIECRAIRKVLEETSQSFPE